MLCRRRKAVSTLIGALIAISILFTVLIPLIFSMYASRRAVEMAHSQRLSFLELKERETLTMEYTPGLGTVTVSVKNKGPVEVALIRIWVFTTSGLEIIPISPPVCLAPGGTWSTSINVDPSVVECIAVETRRGNIFTIKPAVLQAAVPVSMYNLVIPSTSNLEAALGQLQPAAIVGGKIQAIDITQYPAVYRYLFTYDIEYVPVGGKGRWATYVPVVSASYSSAGQAPLSDILFTTDIDGNGLSEIDFSTLGVTVDAVNKSTGGSILSLRVVRLRELGLNSWIATIELKGPTELRLNYNPNDDPSIRENKTFYLGLNDWVTLWVYKPENLTYAKPDTWQTYGSGVINGTTLYVYIYHNTTKTTVRLTNAYNPLQVEWIYIRDNINNKEINITQSLASLILDKAKNTPTSVWASNGNKIDITNPIFGIDFTPGTLYVVKNGTQDQYGLLLEPGSNKDFTVKFRMALPQAYVLEFGSRIGKVYSLSLGDLVTLSRFNGTLLINITDPSQLREWVGWTVTDPRGGGSGGGGFSKTFVISSPEEWNVAKLLINNKEIPDIPISAMIYEKYGEESTGPIYFILNKAPITNASAIQVSYRFFYYSSLGYLRDYGYTIDLNQLPNLRIFSVVLLRDVNGTLEEVSSKDYYLQTLESFRGEFGSPAFVADTATFVTNVTDKYYVALVFEDPYLAVTYTAYAIWWGGGMWRRATQVTFTGQPIDVCVGVEYISLTRFVPAP